MNWDVILGLILAIPLGILTNLATPWIKSWYGNSVFSSRRKRIQQLKADYVYRKWLNQNPILLVALAVKDFLFGLELISVTVVVSGIGYLMLSFDDIFPKIAGIIFLIVIGVIAFTMLDRTAFLIIDSIYFDDYRTKAIDRMIKLGGNPAELDS